MPSVCEGRLVVPFSLLWSPSGYQPVSMILGGCVGELASYDGVEEWDTISLQWHLVAHDCN